jgi:hypothetical protein
VGIFDWFKKRRQHEDDEALEQAEAKAVETPDEPAESSGDIDGMRADEDVARLAGEASMHDAERLGDAE